jgi:hypothetical protein
MGKNRRKNLRNIVVNKQDYKWLASDFNCDGDGSTKLSIWKDKKSIHRSLETGEITPAVVEKIILQIEKK